MRQWTPCGYKCSATTEHDTRAAWGRTAEGQRRQRILHDLLKAQELDDGEVHGGVKAQPALVGPECAVELHPEAAVHMLNPFVIDPGHLQSVVAW